MRIREMALAIPVVLGVAACSSTQGARTARAERAAPAAPQASAADQTVREHSDDQVVAGAISRLGPGGTSVTIATQDGTQKTLSLVPETSVTVDGRDADRTALTEGMPVRASFNTVEDRDVAVHIFASKGAASTGPAIDPGAGGTGGMHGGDSSGGSQTTETRPHKRQ